MVRRGPLASAGLVAVLVANWLKISTALSEIVVGTVQLLKLDSA
jgi:hypothetical protein